MGVAHTVQSRSRHQALQSIRRQLLHDQRNLLGRPPAGDRQPNPNFPPMSSTPPRANATWRSTSSCDIAPCCVWGPTRFEGWELSCAHLSAPPLPGCPPLLSRSGTATLTHHDRASLMTEREERWSAVPAHAGTTIRKIRGMRRNADRRTDADFCTSRHAARTAVGTGHSRAAFTGQTAALVNPSYNASAERRSSRSAMQSWHSVA